MDLRYPIGKFTWEENVTDKRRGELIGQIEEAPSNLRTAVKGLSENQLNTSYRDGGWTVRQVVHHLADSHMNAYVRFKLALTEKGPTVKPYNQEDWAELRDAKTAPVDLSLTLLESLHQRWVLMLNSMKPADFAREFLHPEHGELTLDKNLALYPWHGRHHVAHITSLRERMGWR